MTDEYPGMVLTEFGWRPRPGAKVAQPSDGVSGRVLEHEVNLDPGVSPDDVLGNVIDNVNLAWKLNRHCHAHPNFIGWLVQENARLRAQSSETTQAAAHDEMARARLIEMLSLSRIGSDLCQRCAHQIKIDGAELTRLRDQRAEMLAALKVAAEIFDAMAKYGVIGFDPDEACNYYMDKGVVSSIHATINRAEGRQP